MDIIAFYLPQFYCFPENDRWWGKGFTEWTNVKKAKPLFRDHYQPTVPLNKNYYCLDNVEVMRWQAKLAKEYGLSGFCFYHYWFGEGRQLMEKPVDNYLRNTEIDFPYCLCWANHNWSRTWVGGDQDILIDVKYGDQEEWERHFQYLLPFFRDSRYMTTDGKPILVIYQPQLIECFSEMISYFQRRAKNEGLKGITIIAQALFNKSSDDVESFIDYKIQYEPNYSRNRAWQFKFETMRCCPGFLVDLYMYKFKGVIKRLTNGRICKYRCYSYDLVWKYIIKRKDNDRKYILGAFVKCDVTPRRQERALIYKGSSPKKFAKYLKLLVKKAEKRGGKQIVFLSAWNEWGEGMYLEPDEKYKYEYLEGVKNAVI